MNFEQFEKLSDEIFAEVRLMRDTKGKEYANSEDRFANFNRLASRMDLPREVIWQVYFTKHMDAIESYIRNKRTYSTESIRGRIVDAITYLTLIAGMIEENAKADQDTCWKCNRPFGGCPKNEHVCEPPQHALPVPLKTPASNCPFCNNPIFPDKYHQCDMMCRRCGEQMYWNRAHLCSAQNNAL